MAIDHKIMALSLKKVEYTSNYLQGSLPNEMRAMRTYTLDTCQE